MKEVSKLSSTIQACSYGENVSYEEQVPRRNHQIPLQRIKTMV